VRNKNFSFFISRFRKWFNPVTS